MRYSRDMYLTVSISNFFSLYPVTFAYRFLIILLYWWSVNAIFFERRNTRYLRDADRAFSARDLWVKKYQIFGGSYQCVCAYRGNAYEISPPDFRRTYLLISPFIVTIYIYICSSVGGDDGRSPTWHISRLVKQPLESVQLRAPSISLSSHSSISYQLLSYLSHLTQHVVYLIFYAAPSILSFSWLASK